MSVAAYDHGIKAGNPGDLIKHAALAVLLSGLSKGHPEHPFVYAESHAGPPLHRLSAGGEWEMGIGRFSTLRPLPSRLGALLRPYLRHAFAVYPLTVGDIYPGSTALASRLLGAGARLRLWERNPSVAEALRSAHPGAKVTVGDGVAGVSALGHADFVLIDPVRLDVEELTGLLVRLTVRAVPFLCWSPRRGAAGDGEDEPGRRFHRWAEERLAVETVRWRAWGEATCGCRLVASHPLDAPLGEAVEAIRELMGWSP